MLAYLRKRLRDPSAWIAVGFVVPIAVAAVRGLSPQGYWNTIQVVGLIMTLLEWVQLATWKHRQARFTEKVVVALRPASDRWKVAWMIPVTLFLFLAELWVERDLLHQTSILNFCLTALGLSTMVSLWYAWSRPIRASNLGIIVGTDLEPWSHISGVSWNKVGEGAMVRFDFGGAGHFWYGTKVRAIASPAQLDRLSSILPAHVTQRPAVELPGGGTA